MEKNEKHKVAVAQFSTEVNLEKNLDKAEAFLSDATQNQAKIILFPEEFLTHKMPPDEKKIVAAPLNQHKLVEHLSALSKKYKIYVLAGTIPVRHDDSEYNDDHKKYYNSSILFNPNGKTVAIYHKIHLFDVQVSANNFTTSQYLESKLVDCGSDIIVVNTSIGKLGLSICYDIRFPELFRKQIKQGAQIIATPSAFTVETGEAHWEILLRARAIENLSYVLAPAQMGDRYDGRKTYGYSMIISPWGKVIQNGKDQEGIIYAELDLLEQQVLRENFPALNHIKLI